MLCAADISWEGFTFQHGFRILRPRYEPMQLSPAAGTDGSALTPGLKSEAGDTPIKVSMHSPSFKGLLLHHEEKKCGKAPQLLHLQGAFKWAQCACC